MTAFVAGATGYVGREVVRELLARGVRTIAHVRPDSPRLDEWKRRFAALGVETSSAAWDARTMREALGELAPDHVFCLVGTTRKRGRGARRGGAAETYESVDYGLTALLAEAAAEARGERIFVHLSSLGASPAARGAYLRARWRAEEAVRACGLPYVVVRASFISGPDRPEPRPLERAAAAASDAALGLAARLGASGLRDRFRSRDARAVAGELVRLAFDPAALRHTFEPPFSGPIG